MGTFLSHISALARKKVWSPPIPTLRYKVHQLTHWNYQINTFNVLLLNLLLWFYFKLLVHLLSNFCEMTDNSMMLVMRLLPCIYPLVRYLLTVMPDIHAQCMAYLADLFSWIYLSSKFYILKASSCTCSPLAWFNVCCGTLKLLLQPLIKLI